MRNVRNCENFTLGNKSLVWNQLLAHMSSIYMYVFIGMYVCTCMCL